MNRLEINFVESAMRFCIPEESGGDITSFPQETLDLDDRVTILPYMNDGILSLSIFKGKTLQLKQEEGEYGELHFMRRFFANPDCPLPWIKVPNPGTRATHRVNGVSVELSEKEQLLVFRW